MKDETYNKLTTEIVSALMSNKIDETIHDKIKFLEDIKTWLEQHQVRGKGYEIRRRRDDLHE